MGGPKNAIRDIPWGDEAWRSIFSLIIDCLLWNEDESCPLLALRHASTGTHRFFCAKFDQWWIDWQKERAILERTWRLWRENVGLTDEGNDGNPAIEDV